MEKKFEKGSVILKVQNCGCILFESHTSDKRMLKVGCDELNIWIRAIKYAEKNHKIWKKQ